MSLLKKRSKIAYVGNSTVKVPDGTVIVASDMEYVMVCRQLPESSTLSCWVRQKAHYAWLKSFADRSGLDVEFVELAPRAMLAERWGFSLPVWLNDEIVTEQNLFEIEFSASRPATFVDAMLVTFAGKSFLADKADMTGIMQAVVAITSDEARRHFQTYPVLKQCLQEKCKGWSGGAPDVWVKDLCLRLAAEAESVWRELTLWALLSKYPGRLLEYVLPAERVVMIRKIPVGELIQLPLHRVAAEQADDQIEMFFKDMTAQVKDAKDIGKVIGCASGQILREFELIEGLLKNIPCEPSIADLQIIRDTFRSCPGLSVARLASLGRFMRPPRPTNADQQKPWNAEQWIRWTIGEYLPYRHWQIQNRRYDAELENTVKAFSDWYVEEYESIHQDPAKSLVHALTAHQADILRDELAVILVVDCLPSTFQPLLQDALQKAAFSRHSLEHRFAPLPSHTSVSKPRLLSGQWDVTGKSYPALIGERTVNDWHGKKAVYLQDLKALSDLPRPTEPTVLVLNFLPSDETLHSDVEARNCSYEEELYRLFARLADSLREFVDRWSGPMDRCGVYVLTDHGATRTLDEERKTFDSKVIDKLFSDEKHRFATVIDNEAIGIPENLWKLGYRFKQPFCGENLTYFIPQGHNTVRMSGSGVTYVHGGATPEEVSVTTLIFRPIKANRQLPAVRFSGLRQDSERARLYSMFKGLSQCLLP
jgi:hypothetical protein